MPENDGNGKVSKVIRYQTEDGTIFTSKEDAIEYDNKLAEDRENLKLWSQGNEYLIGTSKRLKDINGSYSMISGEVDEKGGVYGALTSMIIDTPETTMKLLKGFLDLRR